MLDPDAGLDLLKLQAGPYRCRTIKLGSRDSTSLRYISNAAFDCSVTNEGDALSFAEMSGTQRPMGSLFKADNRRRVFSGMMMLGDERRATRYGKDEDRDPAGAFERIGAMRRRLVLPYLRIESLFEIVERVPSS